VSKAPMIANAQNVALAEVSLISKTFVRFARIVQMVAVNVGIVNHVGNFVPVMIQVVNLVNIARIAAIVNVAVIVE
jgi:hypothetical protein